MYIRINYYVFANFSFINLSLHLEAADDFSVLCTCVYTFLCTCIYIYTYIKLDLPLLFLMREMRLLFRPYIYMYLYIVGVHIGSYTDIKNEG